MPEKLPTGAATHPKSERRNIWKASSVRRSRKTARRSRRRGCRSSNTQHEISAPANFCIWPRALLCCPLRRRTRPGVLTPSGHLWRSSSLWWPPPSMQQKAAFERPIPADLTVHGKAPRCICGPSPHGRRAHPRGVDSQNEGEKNVEISNYVTSPPSESASDLADFHQRQGHAPRFEGKGRETAPRLCRMGDAKVVQPNGCGQARGGVEAWIPPPGRGSDDPPFKN
jgi:hypothetical protein